MHGHAPATVLEYAPDIFFVGPPARFAGRVPMNIFTPAQPGSRSSSPN